MAPLTAVSSGFSLSSFSSWVWRMRVRMMQHAGVTPSHSRCRDCSPGRWSRGWLCDRRPCHGRPEPAAVCVSPVQRWRCRYNSPDSCWVSAWPTYREILPWHCRWARRPPAQTVPAPSAYWTEFPGVSWMLWRSTQPVFVCRKYWTL